jgi:ubiquinone/menaquinone biosynthesis C-methylase UbiE
MSSHASIEHRVVQHYAQSDLERAVLNALVASGKDIECLASSDLSPVDEFHTGGREATVELAMQAGFKQNMHILDLGCGIGGPSRYFAAVHGCLVTGIDLTEDFVRTADALTRRVGLAGRVVYRQASALALPFEPGTFDGAYMMHVGMNIKDKAMLFSEVRRVLKTGGVFAIYDGMRTGEGEVRFPVPWAAASEVSFVSSAAEYRRALDAAGFEVARERSRLEFAVAFFREVQTRTAEAGGPPALGTHLLMKADAAQKLANVVDALENGVIAPIELICLAR